MNYRQRESGLWVPRRLQGNHAALQQAMLMVARPATVMVMDEFTTWPANDTSNRDATWSIARRLRVGYTGSLIRVRRSSDNAEQNIGYNINNVLDTAALLSFVGAGDGFVTRVNDQAYSAGNGATGYLEQPTAASQPKIVNAGSLITVNSKPVCQFDGVDDFLMTVGGVIGNDDDNTVYLNVVGSTGFSLGSPGGSTHGFLLAPPGSLVLAAENGYSQIQAGTTYPAGIDSVNSARLYYQTGAPGISYVKTAWDGGGGNAFDVYSMHCLQTHYTGTRKRVWKKNVIQEDWSIANQRFHGWAYVGLGRSMSTTRYGGYFVEAYERQEWEFSLPSDKDTLENNQIAFYGL